MAILNLPRPRNLSEVCDYLEALADKVDERTVKLADGLSEARSDIGALLREVSAARRDIRATRAGRDPDASFHDFDPELAELRRILTEREKNPDDPHFTPNTSKAVVRNAIAEVARDEKAKRWDRAVKVGFRVLVGILLILAGAVLHKFGLQLP